MSHGVDFLLGCFAVMFSILMSCYTLGAIYDAVRRQFNND